jgi:hypothetical protein
MWVVRLTAALDHYQQCEEMARDLGRRGAASASERDNVFQAQRLALQEYTRLLRIFTDFVVYGNVPEEPNDLIEPDSARRPNCGEETQPVYLSA